jgi:hypothetical protein
MERARSPGWRVQQIDWKMAGVGEMPKAIIFNGLRWLTCENMPTHFRAIPKHLANLYAAYSA